MDSNVWILSSWMFLKFELHDGCRIFHMEYYWNDLFSIEFRCWLNCLNGRVYFYFCLFWVLIKDFSLILLGGIEKVIAWVRVRFIRYMEGSEIYILYIANRQSVNPNIKSQFRIPDNCHALLIELIVICVIISQQMFRTRP